MSGAKAIHRGSAAFLLGLALAVGGGAEAAVNQATPFEDTYWRLVEFDGKPFEPADAHLIFRANGKFAGYGICNSLFSSYTHDNRTVAIKPIGMTMRGCIDPADNEREQQLVKALRSVHGWRIEGDKLALSDDKGAVVARFVAGKQ